MKFLSIFVFCGLLGVFLYFAYLMIPFGKLPGDLTWKTEKMQIYLPITTCLLISGALSLAFRVLDWILKKP